MDSSIRLGLGKGPVGSISVCSGGLAFFCWVDVPLGDGKEAVDPAAVVSTVGMIFNRHFDLNTGYQAAANSILS